MITRLLGRPLGNAAVSKRLFANHEMAYSERRLIGFRREHIFDVVADVEHYHNFIPWCQRSDILEESGNSRIAELEIGFPPLRESYQCRIIRLRPSVVHSVVINESIFNTLETTFRFAKESDNSCTLHYDLVFEFKYYLHSRIAHLFFHQGVPCNKKCTPIATSSDPLHLVDQLSKLWSTLFYAEQKHSMVGPLFLILNQKYYGIRTKPMTRLYRTCSAIPSNFVIIML